MFGLVSTGRAAVSDGIDMAAAEERLLGPADEGARDQALLPFKRQLQASGFVTGSLADSLEIAGVPASSQLEALQALAAQLDIEHDVRTGDRFYVRHEQSFTLAGDRIGVGRVLWLELATKARGTIAIHRFRPKGGSEQFWLAGGHGAAPPFMSQPLGTMTVTSGFGLRADPLDHPSSGTMPAVVTVTEPASPPKPPEMEASPQEVRAANRAFAGFDGGSLGSARDAGGRNADIDRIMAARRQRALEAEEHNREEEAATTPRPAPEPKVEAPAEPAVRQLFMHEGLDLLANLGTPVYAAGDGVVASLGPNGGYGNFIRLAHADRLATIYGHLSRFAPGLAAGQPVTRGELIGFVGSTGRSTGAHLHFEIQSNGRPINPATAPAMRCPQLGGADLTAFRKQVAASLAERERENRL
ncbi:MAG: M23 family metallopeptidase [Reyranella sp.]|nr:M23 family metallopeptidase [Reyranella sp.]